MSYTHRGYEYRGDGRRDLPGEVDRLNNELADMKDMLKQLLNQGKEAPPPSPIPSPSKSKAQNFYGGKTAEVETVLSAISNRHKMDILCALLQAPMSVAELAAQLRLSSKGQAYHYLKGLLAANMAALVPDSGGVYTINQDCAKGLGMILAGIRELVKQGEARGEEKE